METFRKAWRWASGIFTRLATWAAEPRHRGFVLLQGAFVFTVFAILVFDLAFGKYPHSGISAVLIAVVAASMSIHNDMRPSHKAIWMLLIGAFLFAELISIKHEAHEEYSVRQSQINTLRTISNGIKTQADESQQQFDATMEKYSSSEKEENKHFEATEEKLISQISQSQEILNNVTGGKTFLILDRMWGNNRSIWEAIPTGGAMLHGVSVEITDLDQVADYIKQHPHDWDWYAIPRLTTTLGDFSPTVARSYEIALLPQPRTARLNMNFFAMNGSWQERYVCREINGTLQVAIRVTREKKEKNKSTNETIYTLIPKEFPVDRQGIPIDEKGAPMW